MLASYFARNYAMYAFASQYQSANQLVVPTVCFPTEAHIQQYQQQNSNRMSSNKCKMNMSQSETKQRQDGSRRHRAVRESSGNASSEIKFSIDRILSKNDDKSGKLDPSSYSNNVSDTEDAESDNEEIENVKTEALDAGGESLSYSWLQCTRYKPPKLQRIRKKDSGKKRKLGRNPRVPFTQHQVAALEQKFCHTHYLSSMDVVELSTALSLTETRVKIWFQNRRARERRDRDTNKRGCQDLSQPRGQQLMYNPTVPSSKASWGMTTPPTTATFTQLHEALHRGNSTFTPVSFNQNCKGT